MAAQPLESKKEEFRKYLESAGVVDQLTRVLVGLYEEPEKPANALEFIKKYLGSPADVDAEKLALEYEKIKQENETLRLRVEQLEQELESLRNAE